MSALSTSSNYGGRVQDNQQGVKQFYSSSQSTSVVNWIYKKLSSKVNVIMPQNAKVPVYIGNDLIVDKNLYVNGSIYNPSDERLKENISHIREDKCDQLFTLNPIHFTYKYDLNKTPHFGLIAQEIETVFPELVISREHGYKSVNYQELIPIILCKMKYMQLEIDLLKENKSI